MRSPEKETELSALDQVFVTKLDVTDKASIQNAVKADIEKLGEIDVLVNNVGYGVFGALKAATEAEIKRQFDVNFLWADRGDKSFITGYASTKIGRYHQRFYYRRQGYFPILVTLLCH